MESQAFILNHSVQLNTFSKSKSISLFINLFNEPLSTE